MTEELFIRQKLAVAHHVIHYFGWDDLLATHISARLPNNEILITPHNVSFDKVNASNIVKTNLDANIISDNGYEVMPQAANIHLETYKVRQDINCIIHTHSDSAVVISSLSKGMIFFNQQSLRFYNEVAYHDYDGLALADEGKHIAKSLGDKNILILNNHGVITTSITIEKCIYSHYYLEKSFDLQLKALSTQQDLREIPENICLKTYNQFKKVETPNKEFQYFKELTKNYSI